MYAKIRNMEEKIKIKTLIILDLVTKIIIHFSRIVIG